MNKKSKRINEIKEKDIIEDDIIKKKKTSKKKIIIIAVSVFLALMAALLIVLAIISNRGVNYLKDDLSEYISIDPSVYESYTATIPKKEIGDSEIERLIMNLLYEKRNKTPLESGAKMFSVPLTVGDKAYVYFRGYTKDENGRDMDIEDACNLKDKKPSSAQIGSLSLYEGFEEALIGKTPSEHTLKKNSSGKVSAGDVVYLSYIAMYSSDGKNYKRTSVRIDLSEEDVDAKYGEGFATSLIGQNIGEYLPACIYKIGEEEVVYGDMVVDFTTEKNNPIIAEVTMPIDYEDKALRNKKVTFEIYLDGANLYKAPEYNESFIKDTLAISDEDLAGYEGETLVKKHRAKLKEELEAELSKTKKLLVEEELWDILNASVKVYKLPKKEVREVYNEYLEELHEEYYYYKASYKSVADFAIDYYKISSSANYKEYIASQAENVIVEKLIFYYIARYEKLLPTGEEYRRLYEETVAEYLDYYIEKKKDEIDVLDTEEKKAKKIAEIKAEMMEYYDEEYFRETVYYTVCMDALLENATVIEK